MPIFKVALMLHSSQVFIVNAPDTEHAIEKISRAWDNGSIALNNPEFNEADFSVIGYAPEDILADL